MKDKTPSESFNGPASGSRRRACSAQNKVVKAHLIGMDFQKDGEHKRITKGEKFTLVGGTKASHEAMTEATVKTFEDLKRKGKTLEGADPREVGDLLKKHYPKV